MSMLKTSRRRSVPSGSLWRSRWAAIGAAVAVTLGAGGLVAVNAAPSAPSSFVSVDPARILDTRTDVGLPGPFVSGVSQKLQVTGIVPTQPPGNAAPVNAEVVASAATSVVFNVTVVSPATKGFLSIRPGDATGTPATSNINWAAGGANIANAVTVQLPASGQIDIFVDGTVGHVLVDVAGYNVPAALGPPGPTGDTGPAGAAFIGSWPFTTTTQMMVTTATKPNGYFATVSLQPGTYLATGDLTVKNSHTTLRGTATCHMYVNDGPQGAFSIQSVGPDSPSFSGLANLGFSQTFEVTSTASYDIGPRCFEDGSGSTILQYWFGNLTILRLDPPPT